MINALNSSVSGLITQSTKIQVSALNIARANIQRIFRSRQSPTTLSSVSDYSILDFK